MVDIISGIAGLILDVTDALSFPTWLWILLLAIGFVIIPFIAFHKMRLQRDSIIQKSEAVLRYKGWLSSVQHFEYEGKIIRRWFTTISFVNVPLYSSERGIAKQVVGHIEFWDSTRRNLLFEMVGRWADTPEAFAVGYIADNIPVNILPNEFERRLNIVIKYDDDDDCYGYNNDSQKFKRWCDPSKVLDPGIYQVKVRLRGIGIGEDFWFIFENKGGQYEPTLQHT